MKIILASLLGLYTFLGFTQQPLIEVEHQRDDLKKYFNQYDVDGAFILYDPGKAVYTICNHDYIKQSYSPASTFKICNSLIGLETGVIKDENFVIKWDSIKRPNKDWNADHDLKSAFKHSTVWYYQELACRVGNSRMKTWLDKIGYGNADTTGGIDKFWLTGNLRITPLQQIDFLKRLYNYNLPVSKRTIDIVKGIMIAEETPTYKISAKAGWGIQDGMDIGWYVGYVEINGKVYYFVNYIQSKDTNNNNFARARMDITYAILKELKIIE